MKQNSHEFHPITYYFVRVDGQYVFGVNRFNQAFDARLSDERRLAYPFDKRDAEIIAKQFEKSANRYKVEIEPVEYEFGGNNPFVTEPIQR